MIKILNSKEVSKDEVLYREMPETDIESVVAQILSNVKQHGDAALLEYSERFDKVKLETLEVERERIKKALNRIEPQFLEVLKKAAGNIKRFHEKQVRNSFILNDKHGVILGQKVLALETVGLYVPGGTASYPSSVLMNGIPAKIAGCKQIIMVTPPNEKGDIADEILAAANIAGVDRIFKVGGAQAIAALTYGTKSIPKVDKIVGPGNIYVAEAKKQVYGQVAIDMIAGPSEILVIADESCNPRYVAADLLSQAEHDRMATSVLITTSEDLGLQVQKEIEVQLKSLEREEIARSSIDSNGKIIIVESIEEAIELSNELAPEHLELCLDNPFDYLDLVKNAGSVFLGKNCPEALGDYLSGSNHTLPTLGTARFSSPLSVDDFVKKYQYSYYTEAAFSEVARDVELFANKEGLTAHARSAMIRMEE